MKGPGSAGEGRSVGGGAVAVTPLLPGEQPSSALPTLDICFERVSALSILPRDR